MNQIRHLEVGSRVVYGFHSIQVGSRVVYGFHSIQVGSRVVYGFHSIQVGYLPPESSRFPLHPGRLSSARVLYGFHSIQVGYLPPESSGFPLHPGRLSSARVLYGFHSTQVGSRIVFLALRRHLLVYSVDDLSVSTLFSIKSSLRHGYHELANTLLIDILLGKNIGSFWS
ncbi:hypothetical protein SAY86_024582 [Trapa natans]|uniref:Uncharacterized protein n=1 Tax=Trapa natans TaxID=22666 RepID=A0AAN7RDI9_TRANT|nr:hypothetical protein SAY86_024582 [Trapa natans]